MKIWDSTREVPEPYKFIAILWLSFLMAGVATVVCFAIIDPDQLRSCTDLPGPGRLATYSIGFFLFWLLTVSSSLLTTYFFNPKA